MQKKKKNCKQDAKGVMWLFSILYEICALKSKKSESKSQVHPNRHTINYLITFFTTGHQLVTNALNTIGGTLIK